MIVVDASVLAEAVGNDGERGTRSRRILLCTDDIAVPDIADVEVLSALRRHRLRGDLGAERMDAAISALVRMPIQRWPSRLLMGAATRHTHNLTAYDAVYVALAETLDAELVTADRRLAAAPGVRCRVRVVD